MHYYIIDSETSGLSSKDHSIVEISIIRELDKVQLTKTIKCPNPEKASLDALKITGKTKSDLYKGISQLEAISICNQFISEDGASPNKRCIIAHNASFDRRFIHTMWEKYSEEFPADYWVDTMAIMRAYNKQLGIKSSVKLIDSCDSLGITKVAGLHNAKSDTRNTYKLWKKLTEDLKMDYLPYIQNHAMGKTSNEDLQNFIYEEDN